MMNMDRAFKFIHHCLTAQMKWASNPPELSVLDVMLLYKPPGRVLNENQTMPTQQANLDPFSTPFTPR